MSQDVPQFTGITGYQEPGGRFAFRYPWDWHAEGLGQGRDGVILTPDRTDPDTYVAAWISPLPAAVAAEDLPPLRDGFDEGLATLPDLHVLDSRDEALGNLVKLERTVTFSDGGATRKRLLWAIYAGSMQLLFVYQGGSPQAYAYWLPMGNYCCATLRLADEIWYASDPGLRPARPAA